MIAEKMERQLDYLDLALARDNGDADGVASLAMAHLRAEVERLKMLEEEAFARYLANRLAEDSSCAGCLRGMASHETPQARRYRLQEEMRHEHM